MCVHCGAAASEVSVVAPSSELQQASVIAPTRSQESVSFSSTLLDAGSNLEGLSGWLVLVGLGLVVSPFMILARTFSTNVPLLTNPRYHAFLEIHRAVEAMIVFEVVSNLIFVALLVGLNFLFFKKKRAFPTYMILYLILQLAVIAGDAAAVRMLMPTVELADSFTTVARTFIGALVWIPYLLVSRRVKATFVQ